MKFVSRASALTLVGSNAWSQQVPEFVSTYPGPLGEGWQGFTDFGFLLNAFLTLALAAVLGAAIAYHPRNVKTADTLEEIEAPKVYITYAVIGSLIGIMVVKYGLVVGFVLFGIGGLIRFRTLLRSANLTGHVIFVTLIGLSCGLDLPHVAVLATAFGFVLIYILDARITYRISVRALPSDRISEAAAAYRQVLQQHECLVMSEKKNPEKGRVEFIFRSSQENLSDFLERELNSEIDASLRGSVDWEID